MIDCLENQARRQVAMMQHQQQAQFHQPALAAYRSLQLETSNLIDVPTSQQQQANSNNHSGADQGTQIRWERNSLDNGNNNGGSSGSNSNELIGYYFGSISRETADWILRNHGSQTDGAYLLRSSGPNDDFVLSLMVVTTMPNNSSITCNQQQQQQQQLQLQQQPQLLANATTTSQPSPVSQHIEVLHYKIVETEDSFVALHGQVGDEKFATIDELIDKAQGVATKPRWPIHRQALESQILPPTYWGLSVYQVCLAFFIKAKQWGFPLLPSLFQPPQQQQNCSVSEQRHQMVTTHLEGNPNSVTTLSIETMRTLIYKSLHEFQPWFHGKISRDDAERRIEDGPTRDGRFLVRERDNYSYAMCICHRRVTKHYRIDVLPTGELAIQDGRKFTSLMALVSHYTIMSDGLWCALTEPCPRPIQPPVGQTPASLDGSSSAFTPPGAMQQQQLHRSLQYASPNAQNQLCMPLNGGLTLGQMSTNMMAPSMISSHHRHHHQPPPADHNSGSSMSANTKDRLACAHATSLGAVRAPIKEWLQTINQKWTQLMAAKNQHQSLNSFLFGSQNPLNNHCRHQGRTSSRHHHQHDNHHSRQQHHGERRRASNNGHSPSCGCIQQPKILQQQQQQQLNEILARNSNLSLRQPPDNHHHGKPYQDPRQQPADCNRMALPSQFLTTEQALNVGSPSTLLNCLPQSSGFQLNGQSFIGSPLFAVARANVASSGKQVSSSSQAGSSNSNGSVVAEQEERLISPARSISANLNEPHLQPAPAYNDNNSQNDIYGGSQPSTAIVNDKHMPTSSSSSSGTINWHSNNSSRFRPPISSAVDMAQRLRELACKQPAPAGAQIGGRIMCGQHAGPAYRYTNCQNEENSFGLCPHRPNHQHHHPHRDDRGSSRAPMMTFRAKRAADDSQLPAEPSSQLVGQAALSKFVQFQDGQCLRTHRDTRSIQMAYLSSQRLAQSGQVANHYNNANGLPLRVMNTNSGVAGGQIGGSAISNRHTANSNGQRQQQQPQQRANHKENAQTDPNSVDLMDCADTQFKVDPRLIKSSSIETLCGAADEDNDDDFDDEGADDELNNVLINCKSNAELLQACFRVKANTAADSYGFNRTGDILKPIQMNGQMDSEPSNGAKQASFRACSDSQQTGEEVIFSQLAKAKDNSEKLDYLNKRHDLDELYTALFAELDASLKAQVELKTKCLGSGGSSSGKTHLASTNQEHKGGLMGHQVANNNHHHQQTTETNPNELIYEFDSLISGNNNNNNNINDSHN